MTRFKKTRENAKEKKKAKKKVHKEEMMVTTRRKKRRKKKSRDEGKKKNNPEGMKNHSILSLCWKKNHPKEETGKDEEKKGKGELGEEKKNPPLAKNAAPLIFEATSDGHSLMSVV